MKLLARRLEQKEGEVEDIILRGNYNKIACVSLSP